MSTSYILAVEDAFQNRAPLRNVPSAVGYKFREATRADEVIR
jgi:hypothetical protein